ncbi:hypothetical protein [Streptomyces sp. SPB162]|uniref:hypothetical protein n=1 Tax=Streptomyces sp. SPB162 TaxID=2940560 RepID=UPI0024061A6F|nr:hypothetical protein [Streptomyces sp. SPB162]MDF9813423.1 hypothetical protein [Streptomyces sp. SPB162]
MSTHPAPMSYPNLLNWFKGGPPDTADIAAELTDMSQGGDYRRLVSYLRLHGELSFFLSAMQVAYPQFIVANPKFPLPQRNLATLDRETLKAAGASCLTAISLGGAQEAFNAKFFSWSDGSSLCYQGIPVFATVSGHRERLLVGPGDKLYIAAPDHPLKGWVQRGGNDVTVQEIVDVLPDDQESGYNAVNAEHTVNWQCSFGDLTTPKGLILAVSKSEAFGQIQWIAPYCVAGWVASLMPTLSSRGTIRIPGGQAEIGQNVHSTAQVGSAWLKGVDDIDCKRAEFPPYWTTNVIATLCPHAGTQPHFQHIVVFCNLLTTNGFKPVGTQGTKAELAKRITFLIGAKPTYKAALLTLPKIGVYYEECF